MEDVGFTGNEFCGNAAEGNREIVEGRNAGIVNGFAIDQQIDLVAGVESWRKRGTVFEPDLNGIGDGPRILLAAEREVFVGGAATEEEGPICGVEDFLELIRGLKERFASVHLKAFTMVEVGYFARIAKLSVKDTLLRMKEAGVDSLPGGGAEIFHPRVRKIICDHKVSGQMWLSIARQAHEIGLRSNATMLYGHVETEEERVDHLVKLRELQDQTHGFVTFIPLAFHPDNTALSYIPKPTGYADLRNIAVGRLLLDNFEHIKAYWIMLSPSIAQIALRFGANDLDGTVVEEKIYHDAGAKTSEFTPRAELERLIRVAGRVPVERDTLYRPVDRSKMPPVPPTPRADLVSLTLNI